MESVDIKTSFNLFQSHNCWRLSIHTSWYPWNHGFHGIYPFIKTQDRDLGWACFICWSGSGYADSISWCSVIACPGLHAGSNWGPSGHTGQDISTSHMKEVSTPTPPVNIFIVMLSGHHPYLYDIVSISTLLWIKCPLPNNHHFYCQSKWPQPTLLQYIVRVSSTPYLFIARARGPHPHFYYNSGCNPTLNLHSLLLSFYCQGKWPHLPAI